MVEILKICKAIKLLNFENGNYIYLKLFRLGQDHYVEPLPLAEVETRTQGQGHKKNFEAKDRPS